jgi:hypothetical protein
MIAGIFRFFQRPDRAVAHRSSAAQYRLAGYGESAAAASDIFPQIDVVDPCDPLVPAAHCDNTPVVSVRLYASSIIA